LKSDSKTVIETFILNALLRWLFFFGSTGVWTKGLCMWGHEPCPQPFIAFSYFLRIGSQGFELWSSQFPLPK
jgi:hypothetical protein